MKRSRAGAKEHRKSRSCNRRQKPLRNNLWKVHPEQSSLLRLTFRMSGPLLKHPLPVTTKGLTGG